MKGDRRLVEHQKKYEQRIQFLMNKLRDAESNEAQDDRITYVQTFFFIKSADTGHHFRPLAEGVGGEVGWGRGEKVPALMLIFS